MIVGCCAREEIEPFHYTRDEMAHLVHVVHLAQTNLFKVTVILHKSLT